jgi:hypothetical protein
VPTEAVRLHRRLGARDRWFLAILVVAALVGAVAAILADQTSGAPARARRAGCVSVTRASWTGSATLSYCGTDAVGYCRTTGIGQFAAGHAESIAACRRAKLLPD